jgi:hypothetical protein
MAFTQHEVCVEGHRKLATADDTDNGCFDDAASDCSTVVGSHDADDMRSTCSLEGSHAVETVIFCDWDDTLFPTSWLERQGLLACDAMISERQQDLLQTMAAWAARTLQMAMAIGRVIIVTNAQQGWVETSCAAFMPSLSNLLQDAHIVSARSRYEQCCGNDPSGWKCLAFEHEVQKLYQDMSTNQELNIISLGDSLHEQRALVSLTQSLPHCCGKSLKFMHTPTIEQLIDQHELLSDCFLDVAEHSGNLDLEVGADASD